MAEEDLPPDGEWLRNYFAANARLEFQRLRGNDFLTQSIWRVVGGSRSVIVKTVSARRRRDSDSWAAHWSDGDDDEAHWNYWKREFLAYHSEIPSLFRRAGVLTPALLHATESPDTVTIFLEDCSLVPATRWEAESYYAAARDLGVAQGLLSMPGEIRRPSWLCANYTRDYALEKPFDRALVTADQPWERLRRAGLITVHSRERQARFAMNEYRLLMLLSSAPLTLCHNDFWTRNLFGSGREPTTVIDWAFVGCGPMGADIANMVASAGFDAFIPAEELPLFGEQVFRAYVDGLRQAGWDGDEVAVRLGYWASASKYAWVVAAMLSSSLTPGHPVYVGYGNGGELDFRTVAATLGTLATWSEGALALCGGR